MNMEVITNLAGFGRQALFEVIKKNVASELK